MKTVGVIICAAGDSSRFDGKRKKAFVDVAGRAVFLRSAELFADRDDVKQILLAISPDDQELVKVKWGASLSFHGVKICYGGKHRFETVAKALELIDQDIDLIAVHDAARCCLTKQWIEQVIKTASQTGAAILACPVVPTLKKVENMTITKTVDRKDLYEAQTPQVFDAKLLRKAYENLKELEKNTINDDSMLVEKLGQKVTIVETDDSNIKITRKTDIPIAEAIIKARPKPKPKGPAGPYHEAQW